MADHYDADHLSTDEVRQVVNAIWIDVHRLWTKGVASGHPVLGTNDWDELQQEYATWVGILEARVGHDGAP